VPAAERPGRDDHAGRDEDDVLQDVLTPERRGVVRAAEQAAGQQHDRREDADELDRQQPHGEAHPAVREQADPDEALERRDRDDPDAPRDQAEGQQVGRPDRQALGGLTPGKNFRTPKPRKTAPTAMRSAVMLWRTSAAWMTFSTAMTPSLSNRMQVPADAAARRFSAGSAGATRRRARVGGPTAGR
jgi:hypothetical protein